MDLLPSADQLELVGAAAEFFAEQLPVSEIRVRRCEPAAVAQKLWTAGAELGLLGLSAPESVGGSGLGLADDALLFREIGRALAPGPFLASVLGARAAVAAGADDLARGIVDGRTPVALVLATAGGEHTAESVTGGLRLVDPAGAELALLGDAAGASLVRIDALADRAPVESIDPGTRLIAARADGVRPEVHVPADHEPLALRGTLLAAAQLVGIAEAARDLSTEHARTRVQFGRPIGVNQAVKHACANMAVAAEAALQQTAFAAIALDSGREDREFQVRAAKYVAGRAAVDNAAATIQVHGGMGFTFEHDAHLYLKRARVVEQWFGSGASHLVPLLELDGAR